MESSGHQRELEKQTDCRFPLKKQKRLPKEEENTAAQTIQSAHVLQVISVLMKLQSVISGKQAHWFSDRIHLLQCLLLGNCYLGRKA